MRGVNKVIIVGTLGQDPEVKFMPSGGAVCNISAATNESWKDKNTGEKQERTEWHRIVMFNRLAEIAGEYLTKGSQVYIEGRLQTRKWQDKEGNDRWSTEIVANNLQMLGGGNRNGGSGNSRDAGAASQAAQTPPSEPPADFDDDIPFAFILPWVSSPLLLGLFDHGQNLL